MWKYSTYLLVSGRTMIMCIHNSTHGKSKQGHLYKQNTHPRPTEHNIRTCTLLFKILTQPKSASLTSPLSSMRILLHFMSRWMTPFLWRYCSPSSSCPDNLLTLNSSSLPSLFSTSDSDPYRFTHSASCN